MTAETFEEICLQVELHTLAQSVFLLDLIPREVLVFDSRNLDVPLFLECEEI